MASRFSAYRALASTGCAVIAMTSSSAAHAAPGATSTDSPPSAEPTEQNTQEEVARDIVVTGTRVASGANAPTPVTVLSAEQVLKISPGLLTEAANLIPALAGSQNLSSRAGGGQRDGAAAIYSLRNLGNLRTLVLWDGQRLVPTINQNQADVNANIIPQLLIKRLDVVTGGVSAVYGSDAVAGVVNFVTDTDFNGLKLQGSSSISTYGDDPILDFGVAAGTRFADGRGHVEFSYQYHNDAGILNRQNALNRPIYAANTGQAGNGSIANPYFNVPDMRISNASSGGLIISSTNPLLNGLNFNANGSLSPFVHGLIPVAGGTFAPFGTATAATANVESGGGGATYATSSIKSASESHQVFGRIDYELTDEISFFAQAGYSHFATQAQFRSPALTNASATAGFLTFSYANPFLKNVGPTNAAILAANPSGTFTMNEILLNDPRAMPVTEAILAFGGLKGNLGTNFKWDLTLGYQRSSILAQDPYNLSNAKLAAALDAVDVGRVTTGVANGAVACRAAVSYAGHPANPAYTNCIPLNIFGGIAAASQEALDYVYNPTFNKSDTALTTVSAAIHGSPFSTWAGEVKAALSGEYRRMTWAVKSNADPINDLVTAAACTGVAFNCTVGRTLYVNNTQGPVPKSVQDVQEVALELNVPILADKPFAQRVELTGAARFTHYSTSGNVITWKLGLDWAVSNDVRLRATRSRDIRAPNIFDVFTTTQINCAISGTDPLTDNRFTNLCNTTSSNPRLSPEIGNTFTLGAVFTPTFLKGLTATVDYYKIDVSNVILLQQGFSPAVLQYCKNVAGNAPVCALVSRPNWTDTSAANAITAFSSQNINAAAFHTWGIDAEIGYNGEIGGHSFTLKALMNYTPRLIFDQGPSGILSYAGAYNAGTNRLNASPKLRLVGIVSYDVTPDINVTLLQRWRSPLNAAFTSIDLAGVATTASVVKSRLPSIGYTNVNLTFKVGGDTGPKYEFYANVANLFNAFPTVYYTGQVNPGQQPYLPEGDDVVGRVFTMGARIKF